MWLILEVLRYVCIQMHITYQLYIMKTFFIHTVVQCHGKLEMLNSCTLGISGHFLPRFASSCHILNSEISFWRNFCHLVHWKLSFWQLPVQPMTEVLSKWQHLRFTLCSCVTNLHYYFCHRYIRSLFMFSLLGTRFNASASGKWRPFLGPSCFGLI